MVGPQDDPAAEAVAQVDDRHTAAEADDVGESSTEGHNQDLIIREREGNGKDRTLRMYLQACMHAVRVFVRVLYTPERACVFSVYSCEWLMYTCVCECVLYAPV